METIGIYMSALGLAVGLASVHFESKGMFWLGSAILGYGLGIIIAVNW